LLEESRGTRPTPGVLTEYEIAVVAVYRTPLLVTPLLTAVELPLLLCVWSLEDRRNFSGPSTRGTLPLPNRSFNLVVAKSIVWPRPVALLFSVDDLWNIGNIDLFDIFTTLAHRSRMGERDRREWHWHRGAKSGKQGCWRDQKIRCTVDGKRLGSTMPSSAELTHSAT
jgi:hypothetical protein